MTMVEEISQIVQDACKNKNNHWGYSIWTHHILSVVEYAKKLAEIVDADVEIVEIAALLHDYAGIKDYAMYEEHHLYGAAEAEIILKKYNYPKEQIEQVKDAIISHRGSVVVEKQSKEAVCVADADAIAHIVNVPSLLYMTYMNKGFTIDEGAQWVNNKIERSWNKLSPIARELIEEAYYGCKLMLAKKAV